LFAPQQKSTSKKLPQEAKKRILVALNKLRTDPFQKGIDVKRLHGTKWSYRLRVGELRVIYQMDAKKKEIFVVDVDFRRTTTY